MRSLAFLILLTTPLAAAEPPLRALLVCGGCCHDYEKQSALLRDGIQAQYVEPDGSAEPDGLVARRRARFATAISDASAWDDRISVTAAPETAAALELDLLVGA